MKIDDHIKYWLNSADHDLDMAESLLSAGKYDWCLFLGHLVSEKGLKALYVKDIENRIPIRQVVLFGSYTAGGSHEWSDVDIALVSDVFEGIRIKDRSKIRKITLAISTDLSPLPFRPEEFTPEDPFVRGERGYDKGYSGKETDIWQ